MNIKMKKNFKSQKNTQGGFVALFAVLLSVIVLAIAIGISSISYKEIILSSSARDGNTAFFAADTGAECALYYDLNQTQMVFVSGNSPTISCAGETGINVPESIINLGTSGNSNVSRFTFDLPLGASCARVQVLKKVVSDDGLSELTRIESKGYNADCDTVNSLIFSGASLEQSRLVERAIRASYVERSLGGSGPAI